MLPTIILFFALFINIFLLSKILVKSLIYLVRQDKLDITLEIYLSIIPCLLWVYLFYLLH